MKNVYFFTAVIFSLLVLSAANKKIKKELPTKTYHTLNRAFACADYGGNKICLVDNKGKITWEYPATRPQDVWILKSGNILFSYKKGVKEVARDKKVVWEYQTHQGNEVHNCQPLPDGRVMAAECGSGQIVEIDKNGTIVKTVKLQIKSKKTHTQVRCARKLKNGHYLVGQYADGVVREYDSQGNIVWEFKQKMAFSGIRLKNNNTLIATGDVHKIIEINNNGTIVWEVNENDLPNNPLRFIAGMQRLSNGNTLVCNWGGHGYVGEQHYGA